MYAEGSSTKDFILKLGEASRSDKSAVGNKAANLGELARAGFDVPEGFVLSTSAFQRFLAANGLGFDSSAEVVENAPIPGDLADALRAGAASFGDTPLAVRSSAVGEDSADASFAGQYQSVLDVRDYDALINAVRECLASAFSERAAAYRSILGQNGVPSMAVLVQQFIPADAAGVAFTANPLTGDRSETLVSAVRGLGERLVSGQTSPDEWRVRGRDLSCERAPEGAIDAAQAHAIAVLARRVEAYFGGPQDIEWALHKGQIWLLQARPITALPKATTAAPLEVPG